jgi:hypothetical protein
MSLGGAMFGNQAQSLLPRRSKRAHDERLDGGGAVEGAVERSNVTGVTGGDTRLKGTQVGGSEVATGRSDGWLPKRTTTGMPRTIPPIP